MVSPSRLGEGDRSLWLSRFDDLEISSLMATVPGICHYGVSAGTGVGVL